MPEPDADSFPGLSLCAENINRAYLTDEGRAVKAMLSMIPVDLAFDQKVHDTAAALLHAMRRHDQHTGGIKALLAEYDLSSGEGIVLMCLAEALLRIPDDVTADQLISDKLGSANFDQHLGMSDSLFVNASTWALMLTGQSLKPKDDPHQHPVASLSRIFTRLEEPVIRAALKAAMHILAHQFVMGRDIEEALTRAREQGQDYIYSFDMIGEAAVTVADADRYQSAYSTAIDAIGQQADKSVPLAQRPEISVKLSALWPRYEFTQKDKAFPEVTHRLGQLARQAMSSGIGLTVDAEEADRLELSLAVFEAVYRIPSLEPWDGLGLAVQAYQKRCIPVLQWLHKLSAAGGRRIPVRLVKGAYWDTEIKHTQIQGLQDYPVYTRKINTDLSYLAAAATLLHECPRLYPQFATHNAHTLAYVYHLAGNRAFEFQRLHGMGEALYAEVIGRDKLNIPCRVYAPVGSHRELLPYLMRRLLENGANTSFVNQARHNEAEVEEIIASPVTRVQSLGDQIRHPDIVLPIDLYAPGRRNSCGINFADDNELSALFAQMEEASLRDWQAAPQVNGSARSGQQVTVINPANHNDIVGQVHYADATTVQEALATADSAWPGWNGTDAEERAAILERAAELYETHRAELMMLCVREAGKTVRDSHADVREAIDFLRYYAGCCRELFAHPMPLPGVTGETNALYLGGRGIFLCISPWNFPVAIYTGQVAAALAAGNCVLAKPAEQTSLAAGFATSLLYQAGVPAPVLGFLPGPGPAIGGLVLTDSRLAGVAFTGAVDTAAQINRLLAQHPGPPRTLIAETGGQNAMIVDSSALPQQVVLDVVRSAFNSAGQRCSALRVLYLQQEIADEIITLLAGYMEQLSVGDPWQISTDIGPVIDADARDVLIQHLEHITKTGRLIYQCPGKAETATGSFFYPVMIEIEHISQLAGEVFGPVLHIIRYHADQLQQIVNDINACGYGLTLGIHSRIMTRAERIRQQARIGNVYVNRDMVGSVVGSQPFGGRGLSGTGPKAGGPHYLLRFATEQTATVNTSAIGGNAALLKLAR
jgi:RHH-type proline utilization regulon transcriptional repressor/proline dehydrogenase/delta 1-pyrroline-5-carboxylate dehydrogenase